MLLIHFPFALILLSLSASDYAGDWNDETASQKEKREPCTCRLTYFHILLLTCSLNTAIFNQILSKSLRPSLSATSKRFSSNYLHADSLPYFTVNTALSVFYHLPSLHNLLHHPRALNLIPNGSLLSLTMPKERAS